MVKKQLRALLVDSLFGNQRFLGPERGGGRLDQDSRTTPGHKCTLVDMVGPWNAIVVERGPKLLREVVTVDKAHSVPVEVPSGAFFCPQGSN